MTAIAIGLITFLGTCLILYRRTVEERRIMWQLYELRDRLRDLAYENRALVNSPLFRTLDGTITGKCAMLADVSVWALLPVFLLDRDERPDIEATQNALEEELARPENAKMSELYEESVRLMMQHLFWRHLFLTAVAAVTLIGLVGFWKCGRWVSRRIMSGALKPVMPPQDPRLTAAVY